MASSMSIPVSVGLEDTEGHPRKAEKPPLFFFFFFFFQEGGC